MDESSSPHEKPSSDPDAPSSEKADGNPRPLDVELGALDAMLERANEDEDQEATPPS